LKLICSASFSAQLPVILRVFAAFLQLLLRW
jgi:hypothetical protein